MGIGSCLLVVGPEPGYMCTRCVSVLPKSMVSMLRTRAAHASHIYSARGGDRACGQACTRTGVSSSWNRFPVCILSTNFPAEHLERGRGHGFFRLALIDQPQRNWAWKAESDSVSFVSTSEE